MISDQRFIEETFPVKEVSVESAKEKSIRHGHICTLHIWWARRPLASSRTTNYAALIPSLPDIDEWNKKRQFIIDFSKWENSLNKTMIKQTREDILKNNDGTPPKVLDPFAGGGSIPLEALRLGCEVYASDYNPVATLILKCTLEYPQKYGQTKKVKSGDWTGAEKEINPLLEDVNKWGNWVLEEAKKEIGKFYSGEEDGSIAVGYIWARTIPCQNPSCSAQIPLMRQYDLAQKGNSSVALYPYIENKTIKFRIVGSGYEVMPMDFNPADGTISGTVVTCPICGGMIDGNTVRKLFHEGKAGQRIVAVASYKSGVSGKKYRIAAKKDLEIFQDVETCLREKQGELMLRWGIDPVPDETIPTPCHDVDRPPMYGMKTWGSLFNTRQKLALITFVDKIRDSHQRMLENGYNEPYAKAITGYLALSLDRLADYNSSLSRWVPHGEFIGNTFTRQALAMVWDYFELNPFSGATGGWNSALGWITRVVEHCSQTSSTAAMISQSSATSLAYSDNFFDAVITDPPYYDNVGYANLSDFFYVWLKRTVGDLYPDLFSTPVVPKANEIVSDPYRQATQGAAKEFFESMLKKSFKEIHRVLKPKGIATIVYAHKSTEGWETLINSLLDSGLIVTAAWPLHTEMKARVKAKETASLASSIYIVARKMKKLPTGFFNEVKDELKQHLDKKLERLWEEGISGADFFIAAIGSAIEVFGKYEKVMDYEGNIVRADRLLDNVREIATDYAVRQILHDGFAGEITDMTRFYVLWRWNYGAAKVPFDEARKLAQSCGIDLANEWNRQRFVKKEKEFIRVLGPQERQLDELRDSAELIDVLHGALLLWEKSNRSEMVKLLQKSGYGTGEVFYRVAQAISETLPNENKEKKLLDGFLSGRERLREEIKKESGQGRLF